MWLVPDWPVPEGRYRCNDCLMSPGWVYQISPAENRMKPYKCQTCDGLAHVTDRRLKQPGGRRTTDKRD